MSVFRSILVAIRRFFGRRAARRLVAQQLPKGLPPGTFQLALPPEKPRLPDDAPAREFWTIPIGRKRAVRLFRIVALPRPLKELSVVRERPERLRLPAVRLPKRLEIPEPLESSLKELGAARPKSFRLDADLRLPTEIDPLRLPADRSPTKTRRVRPRTPLARAPVHRLRPRNFRLDKKSLKPANEGIVPLEMRDTTYRWVRPAFRRRWLELHWMAQERISFLGPLQYEWFLMWWDAFQKRRPGAREPYDYDLAPELDFALEEVKEQMLIRRDVKKDENPPEEQEFYFVEVGQPIAAHEHKAPSDLVPKKEWIGVGEPLPPPTNPRMAREAYLQWRTLVDALEER
ncbi:MAG: hypothetical protein ABR567_18180 [Myxococcales bacterium]